MNEEIKLKRPRGNPQFQINKKNKQTEQTMPEEETKKPEAQEAPPPPPSDTLPADLFSDKMPDEDNIALDGEVKEKPYAALPVDASMSGSTPTGDPKDATQPTAPVTPAPTVSPEEIQSQAKQTVDLMLKGYDKLHALGRWVGKIDNNDLAALSANGKINLEQNLPLGKKSISIGGFFAEYNQGIDENIVVTEEFRTNIRPPLTRICIKNNWLLNDEMYVISLLTEDVVTKASMLMGLKKSANMVLEACLAMQKAKTAPPPPPKEEKKQESIIMDPPHTEEGEGREP